VRALIWRRSSTSRSQADGAASGMPVTFSMIIWQTKVLMELYSNAV
jgi:hypothetical protein